MRRFFEAVRLFRHAFGGYWPQILLIVFLTFVSSAAEGIGISALVPAFSFVSGGAGAAPDFVSILIQQFFSFFNLTYTFRGLLLFIGILFVTRTLVIFAVQVITVRISSGYERDMRKRLFTHTVEANWGYLSEQKLGHLSQLTMANANQTSQFFSYVSLLALIAAKIVVYILVAFNVSPAVAVFAAFSGVAAFALFQPILSRSRALSREGENLSRTISHFINQHGVGMKSVKALSVEKPLEQQSAQYFDQLRSFVFSIMMFRSVLQMLVMLGGLVFIGIAFTFMYSAPGFSIATFGVIVLAIYQIFTQVQLAQAQLHSISSVLPYVQSLFAYENEAQAHKEEQSTEETPIPEGDMIFDSVSFTYPERGAVLTNLNFTAPHGGMLGIVGPSGSGKTTVADLLLRLYKPTSGTIRVGEVPIRELSLNAWRKSIGYVTQEAFLINDTIENNIIFYAEGLSSDDVVTAAKLANIHAFIEALPEGYKTVIGERGARLSGGQRQRIVLARILARKPSLLLLDEATSSLDTESEQVIQDVIESLRGQITTIIIAHRLSTVMGVDQLIVLKDGEILESGAPGELLRNPKSYFAKMSKTA